MQTLLLKKGIPYGNTIQDGLFEGSYDLVVYITTWYICLIFVRKKKTYMLKKTFLYSNKRISSMVKSQVILQNNFYTRWCLFIQERNLRLIPPKHRSSPVCRFFKETKGLPTALCIRKNLMSTWVSAETGTVVPCCKIVNKRSNSS